MKLMHSDKLQWSVHYGQLAIDVDWARLTLLGLHLGLCTYDSGAQNALSVNMDQSR